MSNPTIAVVTGAARGIGYAFAEQLAARGHRVLLTDLDGAAAERAATRLGSGAWAMPLDVADQASHCAVAAEACRQGDLDAAGIDIRARALCPDVVDTEMVSSQAHHAGAALLFSGPKPLTPHQVTQAGIELMDPILP